MRVQHRLHGRRALRSERAQHRRELLLLSENSIRAQARNRCRFSAAWLILESRTLNGGRSIVRQYQESQLTASAVVVAEWWWWWLCSDSDLVGSTVCSRLAGVANRHENKNPARFIAGEGCALSLARTATNSQSKFTKLSRFSQPLNFVRTKWGTQFGNLGVSPWCILQHGNVWK